MNKDRQYNDLMNKDRQYNGLMNKDRQYNGLMNKDRQHNGLMNKDRQVSRFLAINIEGKIWQLTVRRTSSFNIFFAAQSNIDDCNGTPPNEIQSLIENLEYIVLNEEEVEDVLKIINPSKASGPDLINPRLLKEASSILKNPLCKLFNMSLQQAIFLSQWKRANVSPIFKNNKPNEVKNYRPNFFT